MKNYSKRARLAVILGVVLALIMSSMSVSYAASGTKKMTVYNDVVVKGNYAYCNTTCGIYKVNLKKNTKKRFVKGTDEDYGGGTYALRIHKGYLYYLTTGEANDHLYRIKLNGKSKKRIGGVSAGGSYAISNGKIYYGYYDGNKDKTLNRVMKLTGKNKKKSSYKAKSVYKRTNKSKYKIKTVLINKNTDKYAEYLVKPNGKRIKLCTYYY